MGWWTKYASRNSSICGQNFLLEITVFRDGGSMIFTTWFMKLKCVIQKTKLTSKDKQIIARSSSL